MRLKTWQNRMLSCTLAFGLIGITVPAYAHEAVGGTSAAPMFVGPSFEKGLHPLQETTFTIIHDTHFHGNFGDLKEPNNIANYFGIANKIKAEKPNSLFIGNGDDLGTSVISATFHGEPIIEAFNAGKLDVDTYGNHDFDMGPDQLAKLVNQSQFPWVSANAIDKRTKDVFAQESGAKRFVIKEVNGVKIGITGLINEEAPKITTMGDNAIVIPPVDAMKEVIPLMKAAGAQFIIVSSHLASPDARIVAEKVDGIDLIVGDHAAFAYESPEKINNTLLWFIGDEFTYLGELNFMVKNGKMQEFNYHRYALKTDVAKEGIQPDLAVKKVVDKYNELLGKELEVDIGATETELDVMKASQRKAETAFGDLVADAMKAYTKSDIALINGGGIRAERIFPIGRLKKRDMMDAMPFTNYVVKIQVTGEQLYQALENGVSEIDNGAGRFPQVSGIEFSFNKKLAPGARVLDVMINGNKLDRSAMYTMATVDFVADGGDGYDMLKKAKVLLDKNAGPVLSKVVTDYVIEQKTVAPKVSGRIKASEQSPSNLYTDLAGQSFESVLAIMSLTNKKLAITNDIKTFMPDVNITQGDFIKMFVGALNLKVEGTDYNAYASAAVKAGVLKDGGDGKNTVRRDQLAVMLSAAMKQMGIKAASPANPDQALAMFADKDNIQAALKSDAAQAAAVGLIRGKQAGRDVKFAPEDFVTRAQAAIVIQRFLALK